MTKRFILLRAVALASIAPATQGTAAQTLPRPAPITRTVTYGDLDLNTRRGQAKLKRRILAAASEVCPAQVEISRLSPPTDIDCYNAAKLSSMREMERAIGRANNRSATASAAVSVSAR